MSEQWLTAWFPVVALLLQVILWGLIIPRVVSRRTMAVLTFQQFPEDPDF